jgi:hypothetical protein
VVSVEPNVKGAFLPASPDDMYVKREVAQIPLLTTSTSQEANIVIASE